MRWPIPSDTERDDRDSEKQVAAFDRVAEKRRLMRFEESLLDAVREINKTTN